ncbi:MAG: amino acid permease [Holosporaceae bacterium]|jgi:APA family basic amino acid/polyamine antiporter|nr:amino acid permease [Holosporaceae bacterium]
MSDRKMGFFSVFAIVFSSQVGSGIFMLPATLAPYGIFGVWGWCYAGLGAMLLAMVFGELCSRYPSTGGPHAYINEVFGPLPAFFIGWAYWLTSWISTSVVVISSIAYLHPIIGNLSPSTSLCLEIALLLVITAINCIGVGFAGRIEFFLMLLKFMPFILAPAVICSHFDAANLVLAADCANSSAFSLSTTAATLCFWGFIGVECATAPAGAVRNPSKTIPRAIILGTLTVALVYFINSTAIMGVIPGETLAASKAPFTDAIAVVAGRNISLLLSLVASIVCIGTTNAWILTSAQVSLGLAQDNMLPKFFAKQNSGDSPYVSVLVSCFGTIPILILTKNESVSQQVAGIVEFSVMGFLMVYVACCLALIKILLKERKILKMALGIGGLAFCLLMISDASPQAILIALLFFASGIFILPFTKTLSLKEKR